jgi:uncharacterized protein
MVRILLEYGANVNAVDADGWTALHWATYHDNLDMVQALLEHNANLNIVDDHGRTAMYWAIDYEDPQMVLVLLEYIGVTIGIV